MGKSRKEKEYNYNENFSMIPTDYYERIEWLVDKYRLKPNKFDEILRMRDAMMNTLYYNDIILTLYEIPEGAIRPRFRVINRMNFANVAMQNSQFVHVYSPQAKEDNIHMKRLQEDELKLISEDNSLICTPCIVTYNVYHKTPSNYNINEIFMAEMGIDRPITKPDWDNIAKKYSDMTNHNIWLDDSFVTDGQVRRWYSVLPRIEIQIRYLNMMYNKKQFNYVSGRKDYAEFNCNADYFNMEEYNAKHRTDL